MKFSGYVQYYSTVTFGQQSYDEGSAQYLDTEPTWNNMIRRGRFSMSSNLTDHLSFKLTIAAERMGQNNNTAIQGNGNNAAQPRIGLWNLFMKWKMIEDDERLFLTFGYLSPKITRAHITNPYMSPSFEKSWSQNYIRRHLVGFGPGRATGFNLGGLFYEKDRLVNINYDLGVFNPVYNGVNRDESGFAPLLTSRINFAIGDPEMTKYTSTLSSLSFDKRTGLSLAFNASTQSGAQLFDRSTMVGIDWQANVGHAYLEGEYQLLSRTKDELMTNSTVYYIRCGYLFGINGGYVIEPTAMYTVYQGEESLTKIENSLSMGMPAGMDEYIDFGFNLHLSTKIKIGLHYVINNGDSGEINPVAGINNYFISGGEPILRGDYLGLTFNLRIP